MTAPNDCEYSPLLGPFNDGELPPDRLAAVAAHVRGCQACAGELAEIRRFARAFRSAPRPAAAAAEQWESAVLDAARAEGLLDADGRPGPAATGRRMRLVDGHADPGAAATTDPTPAARPVAEPPHLWYVRRLSAVAAVVFLVAAGQMAYQHFATKPDNPMGSTQTEFHPTPNPNVGVPKSAPSTKVSPENR